MKKSLTKNRQSVVDKAAAMDSIRKSVMHVLSETDKFKGLSSNPTLVNKLSESAFSSIFKKHGNVYRKKNKQEFSNMVESILYSADRILKVEEAKKQIKNAASIIASEDLSTMKLDAVSTKVYDKLDSESSRELDFFERNFKNEVDKLVYAGSNTSLKYTPARSDLLYLDLILVAEGINRNKDQILGEELKKSYLTLIGMPLVEEHIPDAIKGIFYDSQLVRIKPTNKPGTVKIVKTGGKVAVRAKAYVFKERFPREAEMLKNRNEEGMLRYSFELAIGGVQCSSCGKDFLPGDPYCDHLLMRFVTETFSRILRNITFIGGAYTLTPAGKDCVSLDVTDLEGGKNAQKSKSSVNTYENRKDLNSTNASLQKNGEKQGSNKLPTNNGGKRMELNFNSVEDMVASSEFNALLEAKVSDLISDEREAFEASLDELTDKNKELEEEVLKLSESLEKSGKALSEAEEAVAAIQIEKRATDAIIELKDSGYEFKDADEIDSFISHAKTLDDDQLAFTVSIMKKTVVASKEAKGESSITDIKTGETSTKDNVDKTVQASKKTDTGYTVSGDTSIAKTRKAWKDKIDALNTYE